MKGAELRLMQEYRKLERGFENFLMIETNDKVSKIIDEKGNEKYKEFQEMCKEINSTLNKINDYDNFQNYHDEFIDKVEGFYENSYEIKNYFTANKLVKEVLDIIKPELDLKKEKIVALKFACDKAGYKKVGFNIQFGIEKLNKTLSTLLSEILSSNLDEYKNFIIEDFIKIDSKVKEKYEEFIAYYKTNKQNDIKLQKILDCNKMDSFLIDLGYKPTRQNGSSHLIYTNGKHSVPVPQHSSLNKGLAYEIQKEALRANKNN